MKIIGIIPARMASTRFPGKPLAKIRGVPMVGHVYNRSKQSRVLDEVYVATCDQEILDYCAAIGAKSLMTSPKHERASDRVAEALLKIEKGRGERVDVVVMIQGDEPMVTPQMIANAVKPLVEDSTILVSNLIAPLRNREEQEDPNEVKVVFDRQMFALYFSREPIPSWKKGAKEVPMFKQVCIIPFRRDFLLKFNELPPTSLEMVESVDMMRVLEHGYKVKLIPTTEAVYSVDTEEDLRWVETLMS
jgi:3-deoxy-manno-octulosonate cytidylyltransferase (CMP-KDO synthetase)